MDFNIFKELQQQMFQLNPSGSLSDLRKIAGNVDYGQNKIFKDLAGYAHLASFNLFRGAQDYAAKFFLESENSTLYSQVEKLIDFYSQVSPTIKRNPFVDEIFKSYCQKNSMTIIRTLQVGIDQVRSCSWVYLVRDTDGIVKIFKEINSYTTGPLVNKLPTEDSLFALLPENNFLPKYFGTIEIDGIKFMKQSVCFGPTLNLNNVLSPIESKKIIFDIASTINFLHDHGIAYLDVKPENFIYQSGKITLLDLGISQITTESNPTDIYLADTRFATPEGITNLKASPLSDIFQLGIFYHWLLTGKHPFEIVPFEIKNPDLDRESSLLRYAWPTAVFEYSDLYSSSSNSYNELIKNMLDRKPENRPTAKDLLLELSDHKSFVVSNKWQKSNSQEKNIVLFPARMGIPHIGHIEYISRIINLGFHVLISIQRSYTLTDRDPIQKFLVMKMVAQSLINLGFTPDKDFSFVLTPYPFNQAEMQYHFLNLPQADNLVGVASGNPGIRQIFPTMPILDQNSIFGTEGQEWQVRSWGEIIRNSVKKGDYSTFKQYVASGVENILSFDEIKKNYTQPQIEFAKTVEVVGIQNNNEIVRGKVFRYQTPEQSLYRHLKTFCNFQVKIEDLYQRDSIIKLDGKTTTVVYVKTNYDCNLQHESIFFELI